MVCRSRTMTRLTYHVGLRPVLSCHNRSFHSSPRLSSVAISSTSVLLRLKAPGLYRWQGPLLPSSPYRFTPTLAVVPVANFTKKDQKRELENYADQLLINITIYHVVLENEVVMWMNSLDREGIRPQFSIHLSYNFAGTKRMTDSKKLTLVLKCGKNINKAWSWTFSNNWECLRVHPCIRIYHQFLH